MKADVKQETLIEEHGGDLARFFFLLYEDPLDAEDSFQNLFLRFLDPRTGSFDEGKAYRSAVRLVRGVCSRRERAGYRPVNLEEGDAGEGSRTAADRRSWRTLSLSDRIAVLLLLEGKMGAEEIARILGWRAAGVSARIERALLSFRAVAAGVGGRVSPTRLVPRGSLLEFRRGEAGGEERANTEEALRRSPPLVKALAELDDAIRRIRGLYRSSLRAGDWKRMRRRLFRELPGAGTVLLWDRFSTPLGDIYAASLDGGLVRIEFDHREEGEWLAGVIPALAAEARRDPRALAVVRRQIREYFEGNRKAFTFPWRLVDASGFQASVLDACARVPFGSVRSYKQIAKDVGRPRGMRAVGGALARNPLPVVIPCHRIISHTGRIGGYSGGAFRKEKLLALEGMAGLFTGAAG